MPSFDKLPTELHYCIADHLTHESINVLIRTNRRLHSEYEHLVYLRAISRTRNLKKSECQPEEILPIPVSLGHSGTTDQIVRFCEIYDMICHGGSCVCDDCGAFVLPNDSRDNAETERATREVPEKGLLEVDCVRLVILMAACNLGSSRKDAVELLSKRLGTKMNSWYWSPMRAILFTPWDNLQFPGAPDRVALLPILAKNGLDVNHIVSSKICRTPIDHSGDTGRHERTWERQVHRRRANWHTQPLVIATFAGRHDLVRQLLVNGAHSNRGGENKFRLLSFAFVFRKDLAMTRLLLEHGADINGEPTSLMTTLFKFRSDSEKIGERLSFLLDYGADAGQYGLEADDAERHDILYGGVSGGPLEWALDEEKTAGYNWSQRIELFIRLLKAGANTEIIDEKKNTALLRLLETRVTAVHRAVLALIEHGANIYAKNEQTGRTPVFVAAALGKGWALEAMFPRDKSVVEKWLKDEEYQHSQGLTWDLKKDIQRDTD
ncbi:hypothetical protein BJ508DRAFT_417795 [Ascobolus immersus RN42]|uniref:Uncharacterized protein n=1 Tax=Ascobolus immersus RN42 TaxID=1160509 RepID=A0A3N4HRQ6_ASCIM|nr:hypothetical protein BJ508DRAFT_417795 [Ascobolus immersus RN42]